MASEEKILELLTKMQAQQEQVLVQLGQMQARLDQMEARLDRVETKLDQVEARQDRMEARLERLREEIHRVKLYLELDVEKRFDVINEGIDVIQQKLMPEERMEQAENDIIVLKTAVRALARDVAELKKAE